VVARVARGGPLPVPRSGSPVAQLRPVGRPAVTADVLLERWRRLPPVDADRFREDLDEVLDPAL